jgi:hypothetical protein
LRVVEQLLPVLDAASLVAGLVPRGPLAPAARQALLDLHIALADVVDVEREVEVDGESPVDGEPELERLSA